MIVSPLEHAGMIGYGILIDDTPHDLDIQSTVALGYQLHSKN